MRVGCLLNSNPRRVDPRWNSMLNEINVSRPSITWKARAGHASHQRVRDGHDSTCSLVRAWEPTLLTEI